MADGVTIPATGNGTATPVVATYDAGAAGHIQLVRLGAVSPQFERLTSATLTAGGNVDLTAADITVGTVGDLVAVHFSSSVALRCDIEIVSGGRTAVVTAFSRGGELAVWETPGAGFVPQAGGTGNGFGVSVTNLDPSQAADVYATLFWDEL